MVCPNCGWTMNHHADKPVMDTMEEDNEFGSETIEAYSCPHCGTNTGKTVER